MPLVPVENRYGPAPPAFNPEPGPTPDQTFAAAFHEGSTVYSILKDIYNSGRFAPVDGYSPKWSDVVALGPRYAERAGEFAAAVSPEHFNAIKADIDQRAADDHTMAASGGLGIVARFAAGAGPELLLPGRVAVGVFKNAVPWARGIAETAAGGALQGAAQEAILQPTHPDRTLGESTWNVASSAILGGILGGAAVGLSRYDWARIIGKMDDERVAADAHVAGAPPPEPPPPPFGAKPPAPDVPEIIARLQKSDSLTARRAAGDLSEASTFGKVDTEDMPSTLSGGPPLDTMAKTQSINTGNKVRDTLTDAYADYHLSEEQAALPERDRLTYRQFNEMVGDALMAGDKHEVPQVAKAAAEVRPELEAWLARQEKASPGSTPAPREGEGTFPLIWDTDKIAANRGDFELYLKQWLASHQKPEAAALKPGTKEFGPGSHALTTAYYDDKTLTAELTFKGGRTYVYENVPKDEYDKLVNAASPGHHFNLNFKTVHKGTLKAAEEVKPTEVAGGATERELRARASDMTGNILAGKADHIGVSNEWARPWIVRDVEQMMQGHLHKAAPETLIAERFGDADMAKVTQSIKEDFAKLAEGKTAEEAAALKESRNATIADVETLRDHFLGRNTVSPELPTRNIGKAAAAARSVGDLATAGLEAIGSVKDITNMLARYGVEAVFQDTWVPLLRSLATADQKLAREAERQAQVMGIALETMNKQPVPETLASTLETTLHAGADPAQLVQMVKPQTDILRTIASTVASTGIYRAAKAAAKGSATKAQLDALEAAGIPEKLWQPIADHYEHSGTTIDGVTLPNTEAWNHREARDAFETAVRRDAMLGVTGGEPSFLDPVVTGMLDALRAQVGGAATKILGANLPQGSAWFLNAFMSSMATGLVSYVVDTIISGKKISMRPEVLIEQAIEHGGLYRILGETSGAARAVHGGLNLYKTVAGGEGGSRKHQQDRSVVDGLISAATADKLGAAGTGDGATATGQWTAADVTARRRVVATQDLNWFQQTLEAVRRSMLSPR
jgi:hypothetical protein